MLAFFLYHAAYSLTNSVHRAAFQLFCDDSPFHSILFCGKDNMLAVRIAPLFLVRRATFVVSVRIELDWIENYPRTLTRDRLTLRNVCL